jgi:glycosyltransferase involved in cell wall biosynthesis
MNLLFLVPYPLGVAPSQRFRFEQYFSALEKNNISFVIVPFLDDKVWDILYQKRNFVHKIFAVLKGFIKRYLLLFSLGKYDYVFIHREAAPVGPPILEWLIAKVFRKKIIFDFDDAIWIPNTSESNKFFSFLKFYGNTKSICKWAYKVSCGNDYLCDFAKQFNNNVVYNPTTIDTENYHNQTKQTTNSKVVIGWTGSHSTVQYLDDLIPVFKELEKQYPFELCVISDRKPDFELKSLNFVQWAKETEIEDLLRFDIGIMPLRNDKWSNGKCGFKALQYMSLGIPALVSPVGVNTKIVDHNINGFICNTNEEWEKYLAQLLSDENKLKELSAKTREKIISKYSVQSNTDNFLLLFA